MRYSDWLIENPDGASWQYVAWARENDARPHLHGANLRGADLSGADLSGADLRGANLRGADLRWADLRWADLSGADLRGANLSGADLRGADLRWADLSGADLSEAIGPFTIFAAGRHTAIFAGGYGHIGCIRRTYGEWLTDYEAIGVENGYTLEEIADYGELIRFAVARQRRIERTEETEETEEAQ